MLRAVGGGRHGGKNLPAAAPENQLLKKVPKAPDELMDENSRLIWQTQARVMIDRNQLTVDHLPLLIAYCNSFSIMLIADQRIVSEGITGYTKDGEKKHPALNARADAISALVRIGSLLGLDPTSYRRMTGGGGGGGNGDNEFKEYT